MVKKDELKKDQAVKLKALTINKLKNLDVEVAGVTLTTYDDKINHLVWFYESYKNNNKSEY